MLIGKFNILVLESVLIIPIPPRQKGLNAVETTTYNLSFWPDNILSWLPDNNYYEAAGLINRLLGIKCSACPYWVITVSS